MTIRVENEAGWDSPMPWEQGVIFIVEEGELPTPGGGALALPGSMTAAQAAESIASRPPGSTGLDDLWRVLADELVNDAASRSDPDVVSGASAEVLEEGEFTYFRYRRSADIDVDDLSD